MSQATYQQYPHQDRYAGPQAYNGQQSNAYPSHSVMEDVSDDEDEDDDDEEYQYDERHDQSYDDSHLDADGDHNMQQQRQLQLHDQQHAGPSSGPFGEADFYRQQQQQAMIYWQHQQKHGRTTPTEGAQGYSAMAEMSRYSSASSVQGFGENGQVAGQVEGGSEEEDDDKGDEASIASIPDEDIDFSLNYALHTFEAVVAGQASVTKGDPLVLIDDANAYWWLVRVLKTDSLGYLPAENVETPIERLARLNKFRNVDLALATAAEQQASAVQDREKIKNMLAAKAESIRNGGSGGGDKSSSPGRKGSVDSSTRRVMFAPPTYVEPPVTTWSDDGENDGSSDSDEDSAAEGEADVDEADGSLDMQGAAKTGSNHSGTQRLEQSLSQPGPLMLDNMEPDDGVEWADSAAQDTQRRQMEQRAAQQIGRGPPPPQSNNPFAQRQASQEAQRELDPAHAGDTRKVSATPSVVSEAAAVHQSRQVSNASAVSVASTGSSGTATGGPLSPNSEDKRSKGLLRKSASKDDLADGHANGEKKKRGVLSGLFSRNKGKDKKDRGISSQDARTSEDSTPSSPGRPSEDAARKGGPGQAGSPQSNVSALRLQQREQATHQAYASKYLGNRSDIRSPSAAEAAAAVAQSAAAMRLAASMAPGSHRPASIILSPNPAGPPLLNVLRVFAGDNVHSESSFKTVLLNETTSSTDLIKQAMQRFRLPGGMADIGQLYLTVRDVQGEEMELTPDEKPLVAFQEAVQRWSSDEVAKVDELTPRVKRSSISSISSVVSLSSHPAIQKLGMNDFSDDSAVKIYLNRRDHAEPPAGAGMGASGLNGQRALLPQITEDAPGVHASDDEAQNRSGGTGTAKSRYNPHLTVSTGSASSPERFTSPSAKFTIQLIIRPADLPESSAFDPSSEAIIPKSVLRDRLAAGHPSVGGAPMDARRRVFMLPRNATVLEAIEQGLEKFGIIEGMADGGDDVEDKASKRRSMVRVRYSLVAAVGREERQLHPSSRILDAYTSPPLLKPVEKMSMAEKRRSRDISSGGGGGSGAMSSDILASDPVFILRKMAPSATAQAANRLASAAADHHSALYRQNAPTPIATTVTSPVADPGPLSPQQLIAAQRAASKANQRALISAYANQTKGVDVIVPDRGTVRSSRLLQPAGGKEVVRYSYIDDTGETYDISDLLTEELKEDATAARLNKASENLLGKPPQISRMPTDSSSYVTAPSTPFDDAPEPVPADSDDILRGIVERSTDQGNDDQLEERLRRVINRVKGKSSTSSEDTISAEAPRTPRQADRTFADEDTPRRPSAATTTPATSKSQGSPAARSASRQADYQNTAASVKKIISRHRQQPSIASIMSDLSGSASATREEDAGSTPTKTASDLSLSPRYPANRPYGAVYVRSVSASSGPPPSAPVKYKDDFGMKALMAIIEARAANEKYEQAKRQGGGSTSTSGKPEEPDVVQKLLYGERVLDGDDRAIHPDVKACFAPVQARLDAWDREIDSLLSMLASSR